MLNLDKYIENGRVRREKIAMDIKYGVITTEDIDSLVSDPRIHDAFIGNRYDDKKPKSDWNQQYLDELSYGVTAEGFNEDYIRYLCEVTSFVSEHGTKKSKRSVLVGIIAGAILVAILIGLLCIRLGSNKKSNADDASSITTSVGDAQ